MLPLLHDTFLDITSYPYNLLLEDLHLLDLKVRKKQKLLLNTLMEHILEQQKSVFKSA